MPKKIKQEKGFSFKGTDEKLIRVDNVHYFIFLALITLVLVCACVGGYVYSKDKYHVHKEVGFTNFEYTEKSGDGYTVEKKWSYGKYLDFNEEMYESGLFNQIFGAEVLIEDVDVEWSLNANLVNGQTIHNSSNFGEEVDKTKFAEVIKKYFGQEILYK